MLNKVEVSFNITYPIIGLPDDKELSSAVFGIRMENKGLFFAKTEVSINRD
jgi:hypothetical protein